MTCIDAQKKKILANKAVVTNISQRKHCSKSSSAQGRWQRPEALTPGPTLLNFLLCLPASFK